MNKIILGIDPDSKAHGVAIYDDKGLNVMQSMPLMSIMLLLAMWANDGMCFDIIEVHIEDVCGMNAVFRQRQKANQAINMKMSNSVGKCQQAQIELERVFEYYKIKVVKHKISKMWKKDKVQFEKITGWVGQSNEDTRSAAYFGWLGCK